MNLSIISFLLALIVISSLIVILLKGRAQPIRKSFKPEENSNQENSKVLDQGLVQAKWAEIKTMQNSGPSGLKAALIDADKDLDRVAQWVKSQEEKGINVPDYLKRYLPR